MDYFLHLQKDKKLAAILKTPLPPLQLRTNIPLRLMSSIMSQQLSTKVARVIYQRFLDLFGGEEPTPQQVLTTEPEILRSIGLSNAKVAYVQNVAQFCLQHNLTDEAIHAMDNDSLIKLLTQIKGVGRWTVEMLLMFTLGREDVFAVDDLGIQQAMMSIYKISGTDKKQMKEKMLKVSTRWKPYRTYACLHLWAHKDGEQE